VLVLHTIPVVRVRLLYVISVLVELSFGCLEHNIKPIFSLTQLVAIRIHISESLVLQVLNALSVKVFVASVKIDDSSRFRV